jgi:hypothetical protein
VKENQMHIPKSIGCLYQFEQTLGLVLSDTKKNVLTTSMTCMSKVRAKAAKQREASVDQVFCHVRDIVGKVEREGAFGSTSPEVWISLEEKVRSFSKHHKVVIPAHVHSILQSALSESRTKKELHADPEKVALRLAEHTGNFTKEEVDLLSHLPIERFSLDLLKRLYAKIVSENSPHPMIATLRRISERVELLEFTAGRKEVEKDPEKLAFFLLAHEKLLTSSDFRFLNSLLTSYGIDFVFIDQFLTGSLFERVVLCLNNRLKALGIESKKSGVAEEVVDWEKYHSRLTPEELSAVIRLRQALSSGSSLHESLRKMGAYQLLDDPRTQTITVGQLTHEYMLHVHKYELLPNVQRQIEIIQERQKIPPKDRGLSSIVEFAQQVYSNATLVVDNDSTYDSSTHAWEPFHNQVIKEAVASLPRRAYLYGRIYQFLAAKNVGQNLEPCWGRRFFQTGTLLSPSLVHSISQISFISAEEVAVQIDRALDTICDGFSNLLKKLFLGDKTENTGAALFSLLKHTIYYKYSLTYSKALAWVRPPPCWEKEEIEPKKPRKEHQDSLTSQFRELSLHERQRKSFLPKVEKKVDETVPIKQPIVEEIPDDGEGWTLVTHLRTRRDDIVAFLKKIILHPRVSNSFLQGGIAAAYPGRSALEEKKLEVFKTFPAIITFFGEKYGLKDLWQSPKTGTLCPHVVSFGEIKVYKEGEEATYQGAFTDCRDVNTLFHHTFTEGDFRTFLQAKGSDGKIVLQDPVESDETQCERVVLPNVVIDEHPFYDCDPRRFRIQKSSYAIYIDDVVRKILYTQILLKDPSRKRKQECVYQGLLEDMRSTEGRMIE